MANPDICFEVLANIDQQGIDNLIKGITTAVNSSSPREIAVWKLLSPVNKPLKLPSTLLLLGRRSMLTMVVASGSALEILIANMVIVRNHSHLYS